MNHRSAPTLIGCRGVFCVFEREFTVKSYSIADWCALHSLSRGFFYKLDARGEAPRTFKLGAIRRISDDANNEWLAAREAASMEAVA
jgi:predicted DNA-binding transcriptional regulator AlpA